MRIAKLIAVVLLSLGAFTASAAVGTAAFAQDGPDYVGDTPPGGGTTISGDETSRVQGQVLPITGADIALIVGVSVAVLGVGYVLVHNARRHRTLDLAS